VIHSRGFPWHFGGVEIVRDDVAVSGKLTIQAQSITVDGALHGSAITVCSVGHRSRVGVPFLYFLYNRLDCVNV
jgi:hypothetical protein